MRRRLENLVRKLAARDDLYISHTPRIAMAEILELERLGFWIDIDSLYGAEPGSPRFVSMLSPKEFLARARELGIVEGEE